MFILSYKAKDNKGKIHTKYFGEKRGVQTLVSSKENALVWNEKYRDTWQHYADESNSKDRITKVCLLDAKVSPAAETMYNDYVVYKKISW